MIVVGVDVHKHSLTAVAVDELGRALAECSRPVDGRVVEWARSLDEERLWAVEDCRHVTRGLEQTLLAQGERLVRVPPRLTAPQRRRGRTRGKSDSIDALAIARAALQEPQLDGPRTGEETAARAEAAGRPPRRSRRRTAPLPATAALAPARARPEHWRCRWGRSTGRSGSTGSARRLARRDQTTQVRIARDLLGRCKTPDSLDPRARPRAAHTHAGARATTARARRLRPTQCREAALRDRPDRPLRIRRPARSSRRRRTLGRQLRQTPTPPTRPRR